MRWKTKVSFYRATLSPGVCPSVRPSVTLVYCIQTAEDIVKLLSRLDSIMILAFLAPSTNTQFPAEPLQRGRKIYGDGKILRLSTEIAVNLGNCTR